MALSACSLEENTISRAYATVENKRPSGSAGSFPVKYNQCTALFKANSADAPAKMKRIVSPFPQISLTIEPFFTKYSILKYKKLWQGFYGSSYKDTFMATGTEVKAVKSSKKI